MERAEETFKLSLGINGPARDLIQNNNGGGEATEGDDLQLCLGLSTNGRFGIDPGSRKLKRSFSNLNGGGSSSAVAREVAVENHALLGRAHSLPVEMEEERRQRKELQTLRRMEAMKKRMEKKKNVKMAKSGSKDDSSEGDSTGNGNPLVGSSSIGSYKSGSSVFSDFQSRHTEAVVPKTEVVEVKQEPVAVPKAETITKRDRTETPKSPLLDMPYVSTRGDVHTRIEGFLYRYKTGENIKIVCVCHGLFLSPAEFVKHGGGGDVANPLQHIVVNESALFG